MHGAKIQAVLFPKCIEHSLLRSIFIYLFFTHMYHPNPQFFFGPTQQQQRYLLNAAHPNPQFFFWACTK